MIDQLCGCEMGRFILERRGVNGYWTDYILHHPFSRNETPHDLHQRTYSPMELFLLTRSPNVLAHRERGGIFQKMLQQHVRPGAVFASIPCGLMRDLLSLDLSRAADCRIVGIDIDPESLDHGRELAQHLGVADAEFILGNAWSLGFDKAFDVITSSGLNCYEPEVARVLDLYRNFFIALKPGGTLITSVYTYPPGHAKPTDWDLTVCNTEDMLMDAILFGDILQAKWRNFRSASELEDDFRSVGFTDVAVHFDSRRMYPTITARRPLA